MTGSQALSQHEQLFDRAIDILKKKRADYASEEDPFANFRNSELAGVEPWRGALVRLLDKLTRAKNLMANGNQQVQDESIEDSIIDALNYTVIFYQLWQEGRVDDGVDREVYGIAGPRSTNSVTWSVGGNVFGI